MPRLTPTQVRVAWIGVIGAALAAAIGLVPSVIAYFNSSPSPPARAHLLVQAIDDGTKSGVEDAGVELTVGSSVLESRTDSLGRHTFELEPAWAGRIGVISVIKSGYSRSRIEVLVPSSSDSKTVHLTRTTPQLVSTETVASPPKPEPRFTEKTETYRSGPKPSGVGSSFSNYRLCTPTLPEGARITAVSYRLEGDRRCGDWSRCELSERTESRACFDFSLQGHSEAFPPQTFTSEGFLTVTYQVPAK